MKLAKLQANKLRELLTEGKWVIGTNFKEQLSDINWTEATQKVNALNTIADLTFHTNYYMAGVANVLEGGELEIRDEFSFDYPPIQSEEDWQKLRNKFISDSGKFINLVEKLTDEQLREKFVKEEYGSLLRNIDVIIEHTYYHFGQVVIIKKMIRNEANKAQT